jgi:hypothetical protein
MSTVHKPKKLEMSNEIPIENQEIAPLRSVEHEGDV